MKTNQPEELKSPYDDCKLIRVHGYCLPQLNKQSREARLLKTVKYACEHSKYNAIIADWTNIVNVDPQEPYQICDIYWFVDERIKQNKHHLAPIIVYKDENGILHQMRGNCSGLSIHELLTLLTYKHFRMSMYEGNVYFMTYKEDKDFSYPDLAYYIDTLPGDEDSIYDFQYR